MSLIKLSTPPPDDSELSMSDDPEMTTKDGSIAKGWYSKDDRYFEQITRPDGTVEWYELQ